MTKNSGNLFLAVGKISQLGSMLRLQILAGLEKRGLIKEKEQVDFFTEVQTANIIKQRKKLGANHVLLVGLKSGILPQCISDINRSVPTGETVNYIVVAPEGPLPTLPADCNVTLYKTLEDFPEKMAA